jgi:exopolysaccharide biosynthesis polyprenyl glycosylphosphotransferase
MKNWLTENNVPKWSPNDLVNNHPMIDSVPHTSGKAPPKTAAGSQTVADSPPVSSVAATPVVSAPPRRTVSLNLRVSERRLVLGTIDVLLINVALLLSIWLTGSFTPSMDSLLANVKWPITLSIVWLAFANFFDCYSLARAASAFNSVRNSALAVGFTVLVYTVFIPTLTPPLSTRGTIFLFALFGFILVSAWRMTYAKVFVQPWFRQRVLVVGAGGAGRVLAAAIQSAPHNEANPYRGTGYELAGFIDDDLALHGNPIDGISVVGDHSTLVQQTQSLDVNEVILAITNTESISDQMMDALLQCRERGLPITTMATVYERLTGRVPIDYVGRDLQLVLPMHDRAGERAYRVLKRGVDLFFAILGLLAMGVIIVPFALINRITSPGPLFYTQRRVGQGGKPFMIYKFRSMRPDAERAGVQWARKGDDRVTPVGKIARRTRLDELPQFINIFKGEMSLIGPRPERPEFVNALSLIIPYYRARHAVKPGLTGWAQVKYGYGGTQAETRIKLEYDLYYVNHASPLLDFVIILQTPLTMLLGKGQ